MAMTYPFATGPNGNVSANTISIFNEGTGAQGSGALLIFNGNASNRKTVHQFSSVETALNPDGLDKQCLFSPSHFSVGATAGSTNGISFNDNRGDSHFRVKTGMINLFAVNNLNLQSNTAVNLSVDSDYTTALVNVEPYDFRIGLFLGDDSGTGGASYINFAEADSEEPSTLITATYGDSGEFHSDIEVKNTQIYLSCAYEGVRESHINMTNGNIDIYSDGSISIANAAGNSLTLRGTGGNNIEGGPLFVKQSQFFSGSTSFQCTNGGVFHVHTTDTRTSNGLIHLNAGQYTNILLETYNTIPYFLTKATSTRWPIQPFLWIGHFSITSATTTSSAVSPDYTYYNPLNITLTAKRTGSVGSNMSGITITSNRSLSMSNYTAIIIPTQGVSKYVPVATLYSKTATTMVVGMGSTAGDGCVVPFTLFIITKDTSFSWVTG